MHQSDIKPKITSRVIVSYSVVTGETESNQRVMDTTNHIHAGSAVYSCRYQDIIGIKTFMYSNVCAPQYCLSPMSHRTFSHLCR